MGKLIINQNLLTQENIDSIAALCPFGAIVKRGTSLDITSGCKMCKLCVKKSSGVITFAENETKTVDKSKWNGIAVYADTSDGTVHRVTYELLGKAKELSAVTSQPIFALLIGSATDKAADDLLKHGADKVFIYDDEAFEHFRIEPYTAAFYDFIQKIKPSSILVGATSLGRQLAPRIAARCRTGLTADCTMLEMKENSDLVQIRPAFGGNIMAQIITPNTRPQFCTARYKVFSEIQPTDNPSGEICRMSITDGMRKSDISILSETKKPKESDISEAEVIVAVGRGASDEASVAAATRLADLLGGVVACSRPLVESNLFDCKKQIGLSGRTVKAKVIFCLGISGSVQFAAGMKTSECIIAVNSDPAAPIFNIAHYCVVGDVSAVIPKLIANIENSRN